MKKNFLRTFCAFLLMAPVLAFTNCSDDDDVTPIVNKDKDKEKEEEVGKIGLPLTIDFNEIVDLNADKISPSVFNELTVWGLNSIINKEEVGRVTYYGMPVPKVGENTFPLIIKDDKPLALNGNNRTIAIDISEAYPINKITVNTKTNYDYIEATIVKEDGEILKTKYINTDEGLANIKVLIIDLDKEKASKIYISAGGWSDAKGQSEIHSITIE